MLKLNLSRTILVDKLQSCFSSSTNLSVLIYQQCELQLLKYYNIDNLRWENVE